MKVQCVWEHNGNDTLLHIVDLPGACARGCDLETALSKVDGELRAYLAWAGCKIPRMFAPEIVLDAACTLAVSDADSDVLWEAEKAPLSLEEYAYLKSLALKSAEDFQALYDAIPDKDKSTALPRQTFYGQVPRTANEMYTHTKNVNAYYFGEIDVAADNEGNIADCRRRGFYTLEQLPDYLKNSVAEGSYGEYWTLRKVLRRFIWHDRIHAKAMYRMAVKTFGQASVPNPFFFEI